MSSRLSRRRSCERASWMTVARNKIVPRIARAVRNLFVFLYRSFSQGRSRGRGAIRSFFYSFSSLRMGSQKWGGMGLCLKFSKFYPTRKGNGVLKWREIEKEREIKRIKRHDKEPKEKTRFGGATWRAAGYCVLDSAALETAMFDRSKLTSVTRQSFLSLSLSLSSRNRDVARAAWEMRTTDAEVRSGAVHHRNRRRRRKFQDWQSRTIFQSVCMCVRERECRGNRRGKTGRLRFPFSSENNFYVKRK